MTDRAELAVPGQGVAVEPAFAAGRRPPTAPVQEVLDGLPGSAVFLLAEFGSDGEVADFRIAAASPEATDGAGRRGRDLVGLRVLETYPWVVGSEVWDGCVAALTTGARYEGVAHGTLSLLAVRAAATGGGVTASWTRTDGGERDRWRLAVMQRLAQLGWADWDLARSTSTWSEQVHAIFDRDRSLGPIALQDLPRHVVPEDAPALGEALRLLVEAGLAVDHAFRLPTPDGQLRHARLVAERGNDTYGEPVEVHGFFQDRTAVVRAEQQLLEHERTALAQRSQLAAERRLAADLQHALLPLPEQSLRLADLAVDVTYQPLQKGLNVGGDWYSAIELPDGSALLVIGDVAGHGLAAVATMAQLRFTAKGMAITGTPLPTILARLNALLLHTSDRGFGTATMIMARYDPATSELSWVQAGHPPPLLLRDGKPRYLTSPNGILLGATTGSDYAQSTLRLEPGDHLLLYTDGLVESPGETLDKGLARLARAATACTDPARLLDAVQQALVVPRPRRDDICVLHIGR
ncbi:PP2C family protein-serine/threonine phosphatase [Kitasatospora sp. NPDC059795]|uniref:PP2C family protein-serine/threonine phosphatase n=1 Tax=Kitasatospora sp. NPDC059795 TaxID=3346949 RepID=UPI0036479397